MWPPTKHLHVALHAFYGLGPLRQLRLGAVGVLGVALLLAAGVALVFATLANRETESLSTRTEQARALAAQKGPIRAEEHNTPAEQLARFQQWFPLAGQSTADLRAIFTAAESSHGQPARGDYWLTAIRVRQRPRAF
jgi:hypothetical protein